MFNNRAAVTPLFRVTEKTCEDMKNAYRAGQLDNALSHLRVHGTKVFGGKDFGPDLTEQLLDLLTDKDKAVRNAVVKWAKKRGFSIPDKEVPSPHPIENELNENSFDAIEQKLEISTNRALLKKKA